MTRQSIVRTPKQLYARVHRPLGAWLDEQFGNFLVALDDALFMRAEQTQEYRLQQDYATAIRALRHQRTQVMREFKLMVLRLTESYIADPKAYAQNNLFQEQANDSTDFALVENEALEQELRVRRLSQGMQNRFATKLNTLGGLLGALHATISLRTEQLPLAPPMLMGVFWKQMAQLGTEMAVVEVSAEVFASDFLPQCEDLYDELIEMLQAAGLHGSLMYKKYHRLPGLQTDTATTLFGAVVMLRQLGIKQRERLGLPSRFLGVPPGVGQSAHVQMKQAIEQRLEHMQKTLAAQPPRNIQQARAMQKKALRELECEIGQQHCSTRSLDVQIIDVISMLFNYILDDPVLPERIKIVLVRLQMPLLRVAVEDRRFLTDRAHPARVLLNNFSQAAIKRTLDDGETSPHLESLIEDLVQKILENYRGDVRVFAEVNAEFEAALLQEERAAKTIEQRLIETAKGREQLMLARQRVDQTLYQLLPERVAEPVYDLIKGVWRDVMTLTLLREGEHSDAWNRTLTTCKRLITSVEPPKNQEERRKKMLEIPSLLNELRHGIASVSHDGGQANRLLSRLHRCHIACLRGLPAPKMVNLAQAPFSEILETQLPDEKYLEQARQLKLEQWVAWQMPDGKERRGKLAWRSERVDLMLFLDASGRKLAELTSVELARFFERGEAVVLSRIDEPLMERALKAIYENLLSVGKNNPQPSFIR